MPTETVDQRHLDQTVAGAEIRSVMAAHRTTRSRAIGTSFVAPKKPTMRSSERIAPPMASTLHQPNGTHHPITASAARINASAAVPASQTPVIGYSPEA